MIDILVGRSDEIIPTYMFYMGLAFVLGTFLSHLKVNRINNEVYVTGEGYTLSHEDMMKLSSRYAKDKDINSLSNPAECSVLSFYAFLAWFFLPGFIASTLLGTAIFVIPLFILSSLAVFGGAAKWKNEKVNEFKKEAKSILLHPPSEFSTFGKYLVNPEAFLVRAKEAEEAKITLQTFEKEALKRIRKKEGKLESARQIGDVSKIMKLERKLKKIEKERLALQKKVESSLEKVKALITDDIPEITGHILEQNPYIRFNRTEHSVTTNVPSTQVGLESFQVPHAVHVVSDILNDETLPENLREDAKRIIEAYFQEQENKLEAERVNDAKVSLQVAKQILNG